LVYFILAYTTIFGNTIEEGFSATLRSSYNLLLGDFDIGSYNDTQWILFIIGSMLLLVVMLNLLISIISESFDKISFERMESDSKLRLELILEIENCMFYNRKK